MSLIERIAAIVAPAHRRRGASGQGLAEYALILALIFLGGQVSGILSRVGGSV